MALTRPRRARAQACTLRCLPDECAQAEKISRGALKTAVERGLTKTETLIADDLNYIKGYRYELFCVARAVGTSMCTIHCDAEQEQIQRFNSATSAYDAVHIEVTHACRWLPAVLPLV